MNHTAKFFKALLILPVAATLAFTACSDEWDDHYNPGQEFSGQSLWETIESNPELSNFASVLKATGYDKALAGQEAFSVFAPVNSDFTEDEAQNLINAYNEQKGNHTRDNENTTIKEFVQNHLALYNHSVSSLTNDSLVMMNGKYQILTNDKFAGHDLLTSNQPCANGILYTINGEASYFPNLFEYMGKDNDLDSVYNFLNSFSVYKFNASKSVPGDIVDGRTVYLDSVVELQNNFMHNYIGRIDSEDSTYWMVAPTNKVWKEKVPEFEKYFQYDDSVDHHLRDSLTWVYSRMALIQGTVFSRTLNTDAAIQDSAMSTSAASYDMRRYMWGNSNLKYYQYDRPFAAGGVFDGTSNVQCSNGQMMKADKWNITPTQSFFHEILFEGEDGNRQDSVDKATTAYPPTTRRVQTSSPYYDYISSHGYAEILPSRESNTTSYFSIPNMMSNIGYDIYVVTAPALAYDTLATEFERRPTIFRARLRSIRQNGTLSDTPNTWTALNGANHRHNTWTTTQDKINIFKVGDNVTIPYTSIGANKGWQTELILDTRVSRSQANSRTGHYNRIIRLDEVLVVPHVDTSRISESEIREALGIPDTELVDFQY